MQKIKSISLSRLKKLELPDLAENVVGILEKYDSESLKIKESFDLLAEQQPQINLLKLEYGPHLITKKVDGLRATRTTYAALISLQMKVLSKADIDNSNESVKIVQSAVNLYLKNLGGNSESVIQQRLSELFRVVDESEELETAFSSLELTKYVNELRNAHSSIKEQLRKRKASIAARPNVNIPPIARSVAAALRNLFNQINLAQARNTELDYTLLISDLNVDLTYYIGMISMRATILENKKVKAEQGVDGVTEEVKTSAPTPEAANRTMRLNVVEESENGVDDDANDASLNIKKAAAKSSKRVQPPSVDNEDQSITS